MPTRIANYASQQILNSYLRKVQTRIQDTQVQLTSEKRAQTYSGIGRDTQRLVSFEVDVQRLSNYKSDNQIQDVYLKATDTALTGIQKTISDFRTTLTSFNTKSPTDEASIKTIQEQAFRSLKMLESFLNEDVNGRFLFAGTRDSASPVDLNLTSLSAFQDKYDGVNMSYPTTRDSHLENFSINSDSTGKANWLTFTQDADGNAATAGTSTITATTAQFANVAVGSIINVAGTANNNGSFEVTAVTGGGTTIEINTKMLTNETINSTLTKTGGTAIADSMTFNRAAGTITAATANSLTSLTVGSTFTVAGTAQNNGTYTVESNTGTVLKIKEMKLVDEGTAATPTLNLAAQSFTFTQNANAFDTLDSGVAGTFSSLKPGMKMTVGGTGLNNGTFTIASVSTNGQSVTVLETLNTEAPAGANDTAVVTQADGTVSATSYYKGDNFSHTHRVSNNRDFTLDLKGIDPAFEKAIRAMSLVAQGKFGTAGGLEQAANSHRVTDAVNLMDLSLKFNNSANPQFESGFTNSIEASFVTLGYQRSLIDRSNQDHTRLIGFFEQRVSELENIDQLDVITRLLDDQKALEASYQAMASIRDLSLHNYLT